MKPAPSFRHIAAPLEIGDDVLDAINEQMGVPTMVRPAPKTPPEPAKPVAVPEPVQQPAPVVSAAPQGGVLAAIEPKAPVEKLTIELPGYLTDALKREAVIRRVSVRHIVMLGLKSLGMTIQPEDLIPDARRSRGKPVKA